MMTGENNVPSARSRGAVSRRTLMKGAVWATPVVAAAMAAPARATSPGAVPKAFSSWGTTWGSVDCTTCGGGGGKYTWNIDNTSTSTVAYHGVLFPDADLWPSGSAVSDVVNIYWLPFSSGDVTSQSGTSPSNPAMWTTLAYEPAYGTVIGPGGNTYYAWVTRLAGPVAVTGIDSNGVFHLLPDYAFSVTSDCTAGGDLWVSHAYTYSLNGVEMSDCSGSYNHNYCGGTGGYPSTSDGTANWRNNSWVTLSARGCSSLRTAPFSAAPFAAPAPDAAPAGGVTMV